MLVGLCTLLICIGNLAGAQDSRDWGIAVATSDQIVLLSKDAKTARPLVEKFDSMRALTFDNQDQELIANDVRGDNETIFRIGVEEHSSKNSILHDLPDSIQGLVVDEKTHTLYWSDANNKMISYISLDEPGAEPQIFLQFNDSHPHGLAIDNCGRYLYWTNAHFKHPTIERARLSDPKPEVLVESDMVTPMGVAFDGLEQRLYWTDLKEGIYYSIESIDLNGKERKTFDTGTHQKPYAIAVDEANIYWTSNRAIWRKSKYDFSEQPVKMHKFDETPMGLFVKKTPQNSQSESDCGDLPNTVKQTYADNHKALKKEAEAAKKCLNGGESRENGTCNCKDGYSGVNCEISQFSYYCLNNGTFFYEAKTPKCKCRIGYAGARCEEDLCNGFCLNDGHCERSQDTNLQVKCACLSGYYGFRCEKDSSYDKLCKMLCEIAPTSLINTMGNLCSCVEDEAERASNGSKLHLSLEDAESSTSSSIDFVCNAYVSYGLTASAAILLVLVVALSVALCSSKKRPRIKKRIIVNQNVRPLTYRPQPPAEQCEITIENCCNMNVCETPCFEPAKFMSQKDEKKVLLRNMENGGDDLY